MNDMERLAACWKSITLKESELKAIDSQMEHIQAALRLMEERRKGLVNSMAPLKATLSELEVKIFGKKSAE